MIDRLLSLARKPRDTQTLGAFLDLVREDDEVESVARAAFAGARADRVGFAFAGGYQAALASIFALAPGKLASLSVTESGGGHPRAIAARLHAGALDGTKRWATLAPCADVLFVVASTGTDSAGRNQLAVVRVDPRAPGVSIEAMPETPFAPEVPHATLRFAGLRVAPEDVLAGDGYDRYVKPFRTVEDLHVFAALAGYLLGEARRGRWSESLVERLLALLCALRGVSASPPTSPGVHLALAGILATARPLFEEAGACFSPGPSQDRWTRDHPLLDIARNVREARRVAAWKGLGAR